MYTKVTTELVLIHICNPIIYFLVRIEFLLNLKWNVSDAFLKQIFEIKIRIHDDKVRVSNGEIELRCFLLLLSNLSTLSQQMTFNGWSSSHIYVSMQIVACNFYKTYNVLVTQFVLNPELQPVLFIFSGNSVKKIAPRRNSS